MEATERKCEKCGKEFSSIAEPNDDYKNWCSTCYKRMIQERNEREEIAEHYDL